MKFLWFLTLPFYVLDQLTKLWALRTFPDPDQVFAGHLTVIENFFYLTRVHNRGVAFGMFGQAGGANVIFAIVATLAMVTIALLWRRGLFPGRLNQVAVSLLLSGILGNLTDRLVHGYVVDFLDFYFGSYNYPCFNIADSCIFVAAFLFIYLSFKEPSKKAPQKAQP
ncbi:MAG: signal peptidase II [Verrucomicrobiota bacterium]